MMTLHTQKKDKDSGHTLLTKNCAKSQNSNFSTIYQMSHIQLFFTQYYPNFYLSQTQDRVHDSSFLQPTSQTNLYHLTTDFIISAQKCIELTSKSRPGQLVASQWLISYESLKNTTLPVQQSDNSIVRWLKSQLKYVHVQMVQILVRMLLIYFESGNSSEITSNIKKNIQEISYIYPALKIEISFMHHQVDLCSFFDHFLHQLQQQIELTTTFKKALERLADSCGFMGSLSKVFTQFNKTDTKIASQEFKLSAIPKLRESKLIASHAPIQRNSSNLIKDTSSVRQSSVSCDKKSNFDEFELFRKKKRIVKERLKPNNEPCRTPIRDKSHPASPATEKTGVFTFSTCSDTTENNASSLLYQKLKYNVRPKERTLYHGEKKFFVPKKGSIMDPQKFIEQITASSFKQDHPDAFDLLRMSQRKSSKAILQSTQQDHHEFYYVPETPKPNYLKKGQTMSSGDTGEEISSFKL